MQAEGEGDRQIDPVDLRMAADSHRNIAYYSGGEEDLTVVDVPQSDQGVDNDGYRTDKPIRIKAWVYAVYVFRYPVLYYSLYLQCHELKQRLEQDPLTGTLKFVPDHPYFESKPKRSGDNRLAGIYNEIYKLLHIREPRKNTLEYEEMPDPISIPRKTKEYKASTRRLADLKKQTNYAIEFVYQLTRTAPDNWGNVSVPKGFQKKWRMTLLRQDDEWKDVVFQSFIDGLNYHLGSFDAHGYQSQQRFGSTCWPLLASRTADASAERHVPRTWKRPGGAIYR